MRRRLLILTLTVLPLVAGLLLAANWWFAPPAQVAKHYVGRKQCIECHQKEDNAWHGSDHQQAMAVATPQTVLGNFDDQKFTHIRRDIEIVPPRRQVLRHDRRADRQNADL